MAMEAPCKKSVEVLFTPSFSCFITNLPNPILMEILCCLPLKTLMASKSVCKSWLHLITDPQFPQLHQPKAPTELCFHHHEVNTTKLNLGNFNFLSDFDVKLNLNTLLEFPKFRVRHKNVLCYDNDAREILYFANSCNGLLCYTVECQNNWYAVVCNPCTSEFITFPALHTPKGPHSCRGYGLGFSAKANKFKLLRLRGGEAIGSSAEVVVAEICTIEKASSYSWKIVGKVPVCRRFPEIVSSGTFLQGTLHWAVGDTCMSEICVLTFNFEDDQFGVIPLPPHFAKTLWNRVGNPCREILGVLGGCLFMTDYTKEGVDIWLMKEYGVKSSWTKLFCFGFTLMEEYCVRDYISKPFRDGIRYECCLPISYMDNGEILMTCTHAVSTTVFFYNPVLKSVRVAGFGDSTLQVIAYRPSLVLLKDSMLGCHVQVMKPRSANSKQRETYSDNFWTPVKHCSKAPLTTFG